MRELIAHIEKPHSSSEIPQTDFVLHWKNNLEKITICLLLNNDGVITRFLFDTKDHSIIWLLSYFTEKLPGMRLEFINGNFFQEIIREWSPIHNKTDYFQSPFILPFEMLRILRSKYLGNKIKDPPQQELMCRCFGLYKNELIHLINTNQITDLKKLQAIRTMSLACRECEPELKNLLNQFNFSQEKLICRCFKVQESEIKQWITKNPQGTFEEIKDDLKVSTKCGSCKDDIRELLTSQKPPSVSRRFKDFTNAEWMIKTQEVLNFHVHSYELLSQYQFNVASFQQGEIKIQINPKPRGDDEWAINELVVGLIKQDLDPELRVTFLV